MAKIKIFDKKSIDRIFIINLILIILSFIISFFYVLTGIIKNKSFKGSDIGILIDLYILGFLYVFLYLKLFKKE